MRKAVLRIFAQLITLILLANCTSNTVPQAVHTTPTMLVTSTTIKVITPTFIVPTPLPTVSAANIAKRRQQRILRKNAHLKIWNDANINHYRFMLAFGICGDRAYLIEVQNNVSIILNAPSELSDDQRACIQKYGSIDKLYQEIDDLIQYDASKINVHYDARYAYPATMDIKYYPPHVEGDGYTAHINDLEVLP